ncbi:MAG: MmcQ/YjbR family DNA-binding protein [Planctomycetota bacterium]|nr:MmcQ/YjbR family DNA-binding protein [Planctomycetota bacterium]
MNSEGTKEDATTRTVRQVAMRHPDTEETIACQGTAIESRRFAVGKKAFLFVGKKSVMVKLDESLAEATELSAKEPDRYRVGATGWATVATGDGKAPLARLRRWVDESRRVVAATKVSTKKKRKIAARPTRGSRRA